MRFYKRSYEIFGLSGSDEIISSLIIAIPLILIGFLILYIAFWSKKAKTVHLNSEKPMHPLHAFGCFGMIIIVGGIFFLIPIIAWIEAIANGILMVVIGLMVFCALLIFLYSRVFRK
jgi:hypothetical protein